MIDLADVPAIGSIDRGSVNVFARNALMVGMSSCACHDGVPPCKHFAFSIRSRGGCSATDHRVGRTVLVQFARTLGLRRGTPQNAARDEFLVPAPKDVAVPFNAVQITNKNNNVFPRMGSCFAKIGSVRFCFRRTSMRKKRSTRTSCRHGREQSIPYLEEFGHGLWASAGRLVPGSARHR